MGRINKEVKRLFKLAEKEDNNNYIKRARQILEKNRKQLPKGLRGKFCKNCNTFFKPGKNCSIRIKHKTKLIHCNNCNKTTRIRIQKDL